MDNNSYDPKKLSDYLAHLLQTRGLNMRQASLRAGLNPGAVFQVMNGSRPNRDSCLLLADALDADPNELLALAGYEPLTFVNRSLIDPTEFPPDVKVFAAQLSSLASERRREVMNAVRVLLKEELPAS